jgi:hypothetical protein
MTAKVTFSASKSVLLIEDQLGFGNIFMMVALLFSALFQGLALMRHLDQQGVGWHILGISVTGFFAWGLFLTVSHRHKVWMNSHAKTIRIQRRALSLGLRTQTFSWLNFWAVRTVLISTRDKTEFRVELVHENLTQGLELASFSGKRMEKSFFQLPVPEGEPDDAVILRRTVALFLKIKDLGFREGSDLTML